MAVHSKPDMEKALLAAAFLNPESSWAGHIVARSNNNPEGLVTGMAEKATMRAIAELAANGKIVDINSVTAALSSRDDEDLFPDGPRKFLTALTARNIINTVATLDAYIDDLSMSRNIREMHQEITDLVADIDNPDWSATPSDITQRLSDIAATGETDKSLVHISDITAEVFETAAPVWSVSTGLAGVDKVLGGEGLEAGNAVVIAARAKMGKTTLLINTVYNLLEEGHTPIVVSFETKKPEFVSKMLARKCGVHWGDIKRWLGKGEGLTDEEIEKVRDAREWLDNTNLQTQFDVKTKTTDIERLTADAAANSAPDSRVVLFVDYIQLQIANERRKGASSDFEVLTDLSRFYKLLAVDQQIPVVYLAQLNREGADESPKVTSIKGSGSIEADADTVLLLDRPGQRDPDSGIPKSRMVIDGSVTRTDEGDKVHLIMDGSTNSLMPVPDDDELTGSGLVDQAMSELGVDLEDI